MPDFSPRGFEQIVLSSEERWEGAPNTPLADIGPLGINPPANVNVHPLGVRDFLPGSGVRTVTSPNFVTCSAIVVRDRESGIHTFGHLEPGVTSFESHMRDRQIDEGEAVMVFGDSSQSSNVLGDLQNGRWGQIDTRVIAFDGGGKWWATVFDIMAGELKVVRRKPVQSILCYQAFTSL